jgi:ABC-2 type transport system ATP-binding protein
MEPLLYTENLSRAYNGRDVVDGLALSLQTGDVLGLLGPNGAGKSTALRMLCGDLAPSRGSVKICGHDLHQEPLAAKRQLGYLAERPPLHTDQRVDEYLSDVARLRRVAKSQRRDIVHQVKQRCGLQTVGRRLIWNLSKGYQQRLGIAQAILHHPAVVVLDEPTDGLDPAQIRAVRKLIRQLAEHAGVILSSHILSEIQTLCNRVIILQDGKTVYQGELTPPQVTTLRVQLTQAPDIAQLSALPAVARVEQLHLDYFQVLLKAGIEASQLAAQIVQQGWGLQQMTPQELSLEQIFLRATSGEAVG